MIFDDLHDPHPPRPGMREFAIVAERAQAIRRRRTRHAVRSVCALAVLAGGLVVPFLPSGDGGEPISPVSSEPPSVVSIAPSTTLLRDAGRVTGLEPVVMPTSLRLTSDTGSVELTQSSDGRVCARRVEDPGVPTCAVADAGLIAIELAGAEVGTTPTAVVAVAPDVDVSFLTVGVTCRRPIPDQGIASELPVDVWLCDGLRLDSATVDVRSASLVVIASLPER